MTELLLGEPAKLTDHLNPDWLPTQNMGYKSGEEKASASKLKRYQRRLPKVITFSFLTVCVWNQSVRIV